MTGVTLFEKLGTFLERLHTVDWRAGSDGVPRNVTKLLGTPAEVASLIDQFRWRIQLLFRFLKRIPGRRHLFSRSQDGIELQAYRAVPASHGVQGCFLRAHAPYFVLAAVLALTARLPRAIMRPNNTGNFPVS